MNRRLLIALLLSFVVLTIYGYLVPKQSLEGNQTKNINQQAATIAKSAPKVASNSKTAVEVSKDRGLAASNEHVIATVDTAKYSLKIDNLGRISSVVLKESKYQQDDGKPIDVIPKNGIRPLELRFSDSKFNELAFHTDYKVNSTKVDATKEPKSLELTQSVEGKTVKKIITFYPDGHYSLRVEVPSGVNYFITPGLRPVVDKSMYLVVRGVIVRDDNGIVKTYESGDIKETITHNSASVVASVDRYYTTLLYKKSGTFPVVITPAGNAGFQEEPLAFIQGSGNSDFEGYVGPKEWKLFSALDKKLESVIEFGWFTFLSKPFFKVMLAIYNYVGNWGWAIVLFTILVKIVLFPLSYKGLMSMQKLKDLAPKMKELREKYGNDPMKMNQQMMQLYKKHGANPMGGCLPMLLQIPIFFALYRVLLNADELQGAPWVGWITDLSRQDPYFILPILMGITMYIQQKITPNTMTDPMQQKIFQWLPVIMTFFFITFPSGLVLYWLVNNILTIAQQYYINYAYEQYKRNLKMKASQG